jgi:hypothetical protein
VIGPVREPALNGIGDAKASVSLTQVHGFCCHPAHFNYLTLNLCHRFQLSFVGPLSLVLMFWQGSFFGLYIGLQIRLAAYGSSTAES